MRTQVTYIILLLVLVGCQKENKLTFETLSLDETRCSECPNVEINIPKALENSKIAESINTAIDEEIIETLNYDDELEATSIKDAVQSFSNGYWELKKLYPEEATSWEAKIEGKVSYENADFISVELNSYIFTGGAHGYSSQHFLNFDKNKAKELQNWEIFKDRKDFEQFAEQKFRNQERIPLEGPINSTGFMFESDTFYLPENIGFTEEGIKLLYNPYEVASYADGPIVLTLPFTDLKPYLVNSKS
ncbi:PdaC/SigV domain-containing protein [Zobellia nedashkovskayae]